MREIFKNIKKYQKLLMFFLALAGLYFSGLLFSKGNMAFYNTTPHPYLIVSAILSIIYGLTFAVNFSMASSALYIYLLHNQTDYQQVETIISFKYLSLPFFNVLLCSFLGEVRTRFSQNVDGLDNNLLEQEKINKSLTERIKSLSVETLDLQKKLINKQETYNSIFKLTDTFHNLDKYELTPDFFNLINSELKAARAALFIFDSETGLLEPELTHGFDFDLTHFHVDQISDELIAKSLLENKVTTIKDIYSEDRADIPRDNAIISKPIYSGHDLFGIYVVYEVPFLEYTPHNFKLVSSLVDWFERSLGFSEKFDTLTSNSILNNNLNIYTYPFFQEKLEDEFNVTKRYGVKLHLIKVSIKSANQTSREKLRHIRKILAEILKSTSRKTDYICEGATEDYFNIIITYIEPEQVEIYINKLKAAIDEYRSTDKLKDLLDFDFNTKELTKLESLEGLTV